MIAKYRSKSRSKFNLPAAPHFGDSALKSPLFASRDSNGPAQLTTGGTMALLVKADHDTQSLKEFSKANRNSLRLFSPHYFRPTLLLSHTPQPQFQHTPAPTPIAFRRVNEYDTTRGKRRAPKRSGTKRKGPHPWDLRVSELEIIISLNAFGAYCLSFLVRRWGVSPPTACTTCKEY